MLPRSLRITVGLLIVLAFAHGGSVYGFVTASSRLNSQVSRTAPVVDIAVTLGIDPEPFHRRTIQQYGIFGGITDEGKLILYRVTQDEVSDLSRIYWIKEIEPAAHEL